MPEPRPAVQFFDLAQQEEVARLGMWVFLATEVLLFGGPMMLYLAYRSGYPAGFGEAARETKIVIGTVNTAVLLTSSFAVAWAVAAVKLGERRVAALLLSVAALLGVVFLTLKGVEYAREYREGLVPALHFTRQGEHPGAVALFFVFYFVTTGLHALHLSIGVVVLAVMAWRIRRGAYGPTYHAPLTVAALYWHFVDLVWIFLFALIYLPGRSAG